MSHAASSGAGVAIEPRTRHVARHLLTSLAGTSVSRAVYMLSLPIAARLYSKEDFGGLAIALGLVWLVRPFLTLRYEIALVLPRSAAASRALAMGMMLLGALGMVLITTLIVFSPWVFSSYISEVLLVSLRVPLLCFLAANVLNVTLTAWLQRHSQFQTIATAQFVTSAVSALIIITAPRLIDPSVAVLMYGNAIGAVLGVLVLLGGTIQTRFLALRGASRVRRIRLLMAKYRAFPMFNLPALMSRTVVDAVVLVYLSNAFSLAALGGFFALRQVLFGIVLLLTSSIRQVVFPYMAFGIERASGLLLKMTNATAVAAGIGLGWLLVHASTGVHVVFGSAWGDIDAIAPWIGAQAAVTTVVGWQARHLLDVKTPTMTFAQRQMLGVGVQCGSDLVLVVTLGALWFLKTTETTAVAWISMVSAAGEALMLIVAFRVSGLGAWRAVRVFLLMALTTGFAALATAGLTSLLGAASAYVTLALTLAMIAGVFGFTLRSLGQA